MCSKNDKLNKNMFILGMKKFLPISAGVIPFGLIMGTVYSNAEINIFEAMTMNFVVFAGASQLAAVELMKNDTSIFIIVLTVFVINLRFIMYSASLAPVVKDLSGLKKILLAYTMTDQSYAVAVVEFDKIKTSKERILFYSGTVAIMMIIWHLSTLLGILFGNFAPKSLSLDFAVPLAFMSLVLPSIKDKVMVCVAGTSIIVSLLAHSLPYNLGLVVAAVAAMLVGIYLKGKTPEVQNG